MKRYSQSINVIYWGELALMVTSQEEISRRDEAEETSKIVTVELWYGSVLETVRGWSLDKIFSKA